ncbi:hypothetical protein, partial [Nocardia wallacei]|uniref:hypothetical protein n=1 Tax=Nocardia wallacei TaxID=480035 RepID=UPI0024538E14
WYRHGATPRVTAVAAGGARADVVVRRVPGVGGLPGAATYTDPLTEAPEAVATRLYLAALHRMITG